MSFLWFAGLVRAPPPRNPWLPQPSSFEQDQTGEGVRGAEPVLGGPTGHEGEPTGGHVQPIGKGPPRETRSRRGQGSQRQTARQRDRTFGPGEQQVNLLVAHYNKS